MKSKDFLGFQDTILKNYCKFYKIQSNRKCKMVNDHTNQAIFVQFTTPTNLYKYRSLQNNTKHSS